MRLLGPHPLQDSLSDVPSTFLRSAPAALPTPAPELARSYRRLSLNDVFISFAGRRLPNHDFHRAIAAPSPGDLLQVRAGSGRWELVRQNGTVVGQPAHNFEPPPGMRCEYATVVATVRWDRERSEPQFRANLLADCWEVVVPELVFQPHN